MLVGVLPIVIGSLIFWIYFYYPNRKLEELGVLTILISTPLCIIGIVMTLVFKITNKNDVTARKKSNWSILLLLINIPLSFFYVWFALYLNDTERIIIINDTENDISNIYIFGTGDVDLINKIEKGDSKTVWINMKKEGSIQMIYNENGERKIHYIKGYTGPGMGGHRIKRHLKFNPNDYN